MKKHLDLSSSTLHILAMIFMLMDHLWATLIPGQNWLTCVGRLAFPMFAFMIVEGYFHTRNVKRYLLRLLVFALLSEIPFDLMYGGTVFYPFHQNVLWTFLLGLLGICWMERARKKSRLRFALTAAAAILLGYCVGTLGMVDYYGVGVLTVFVFYLFHGRAWWCLLGQAAALYWLNVELLRGQIYSFTVLGTEWQLCEQGLALLALLPIWLYRGRQGSRSPAFRWICYAFYPVHMLILGLAVRFL